MTKRITRLFAAREALKTGAIVSLLLIGLPAVLIGPVTLCSIVWIVALLWGAWLHWTVLFLLSLVVIVPLLFWTEWRSGGSYYSDALTDAASNSAGSQVFMIDFTEFIGKIGLVNPARAASIGATEIFLWGPRQVLEAVQISRRIVQFRQVNRALAAELLAMLVRAPSTEIAKMIPNAEVDRAMALAYLVWYGWAGASNEKGKVWLDSQSRKALDALVGKENLSVRESHGD